MTARLFTLDPVEGFRPKTFAGHKDAVLGAYFSRDGSSVRPQLFFSLLHILNLGIRYTLSVAMEQCSRGKRRNLPWIRIQITMNPLHPLH